MWPLTTLGYVKDYFPQECAIENSIISTFFVFGIVGLYIFIFRNSIGKKNRQLRKSYKDLQDTSEKLIESEKMASLGMMSAGVAHEINNPLNFIRGGIDMLSMQLSDSKEAQPFIHAVDEGVKRASSIVNSLRHFSRNTSSKDEVCDIHSIIDNCLTMINYKLNFEVEIVKKYCDNRPFTIVGNEGQLHQAILNIISNSEQAIHDKGTITIETCTVNENQELIISDTGIGISQENLSKIRIPFFTTKSPGTGTGLGLSIAYKIIEDHNGVISVKSEPLKGTRFHISFRDS
ncbi:MAG: ATP-binding protein [Ekhidna sp.]